MSKVLFISNITHKITSFATPGILAAQNAGLEFYHASNWQSAKAEQIKEMEEEYGIRIKNVPISRNPFARTNLKAYKELVELIEGENIEYIHCNTPTGGILGRLAGKKCKVKNVIYQAHGFHFFKGAPIRNWLLYYPVEKWLAHYTDAIITINQEDYQCAKTKFKLRKNGKVYYVPGVGMDLLQYNADDCDGNKIRAELGLKDGDVALISMGDLIERKNYDVAIRSVAEAKNDKLHYFICGKGPKEDELKSLAEGLGVAQQVHFLGYRSDIKGLLAAADIFLFTTKQEGLPRSMMEAMSSGLPCIASKIRGNTDLLENTNGGYLCDVNDISAYAEKLNFLANDAGLRKKMGENNLHTIQKFGMEKVNDEVSKIYSEEFRN